MAADREIKEFVEYAIQTENEVGRFYNRMAMHYGGDVELRKLFKTLSADEAEHQKQFRELLQMVDSVDTELTPLQKEFINAFVLPHKLSNNAVSRFSGDTPHNREELLLEVVRFEKAALEFYKAVMLATGKNPILQAIINSEKNHVQAALKVLITGTEYTSLEDTWV